MKSNFLLNGCSAWRSIAMCLISALFITGCGSGAGGGTSAGVGTGGTGSLAKTVSGKVADGYLANATVFLDKNGNYQLDAGEPSFITDNNGAYTFNVDASDMGKYPIVAHVIKGVTIDKDTNQAVVNSYVLSLPKDIVSATVSNFISPITSQLHEMMESGMYINTQQATEALRIKMGLPDGTDMMVDYIATNNTPMHTAAQNMATLMGNQMGQVLGMSGATITIDVNRYRSMMGTIYISMSSIMGTSTQAGMSNLNNTITTMLSNMPVTSVGQPYRNMSTAFRGMMGG